VAERKRGRPCRQLGNPEPFKLVRCKHCRSTNCPTTRTLERVTEGNELKFLRQLRECQTCGKSFEAIWD
jgi:hypothetical protein